MIVATYEPLKPMTVGPLAEYLKRIAIGARISVVDMLKPPNDRFHPD
jgi:hypothetical protein